MDVIVGLIITVFVLSRIAGAVKSKDKTERKKPVSGGVKASSNKGYSPAKTSQNTYDSSQNTITQRMSKPSQMSTEDESLTDIEKRRIKQHEGHMDKRIHRNVHADDGRWDEDGVINEMEHIRDLIVCGYPTEIPGQRDFVKEGEEFLAGLSKDSMFI